jgi:hypothetical protein
VKDIYKVTTDRDREQFHKQNVGQLLQTLIPLLDTFGISIGTKVDALASTLALICDQHGLDPDKVSGLIKERIKFAAALRKGETQPESKIELLS